MATLSEIVVRITANGQQFIGAMKTMAAETQKAGQQVEKSLKNVQQAHGATGKSADGLAGKIKGMAGAFMTNIALFSTYYLSVGAITKILGGAIAEFRKLDESLRNVQSITLQSDASIRETAKSLLGMVLSGKSAGQSAGDLAVALYEVVSSGYEGADAMKILQISAQGASAGLSTVQETSKMLMAILHAYNLPVSEAANVMDQLFTIVNLGVIHFSELNTGLGYLIPTAAALNVPLNELGAAIELLTRQGQMPSRVMTNLNDVLTRMLKPNEDLKAAIEGLGYASGSAMVKQEGLVGSVIKLAAAAGMAQEEISDFSAENLKIAEGNEAAIGKAAESNKKLQDRAKQAAQAAFDAHTRATRAAEALAIAEGKVRDGTATPSEILARNRAQDSLNKAMREAKDADEKAAEAAQKSGVGVQAKTKSFKEAMLSAKSVEEVDAVLARWFGDVRAIRAILPLAARDGRDFIDMLVEHNREIALGGRMQKALVQQQKSFNYQLRALSSNLKAVGAVLIGPVIGGFAGLLRVINDLFKKLVIFDEESGKVTFIWEKYPRIMDAAKIALAGLAAAIAVVLIPVIIALVQILASAAIGFAALLLTNPLGWAVLAAMAIVGLLQATGKLDDAWRLLRDNAVKVFKAIKDVVEDFAHFFELGFTGGMIGGEHSALETFAFNLGQTVHDAIPKIKAFIETVKELAHLFVLGFEGGQIGGEYSDIEKASFKAGQVAKDMLDTVKKIFEEIKTFVKSDTAKELWKSFEAGLVVLKELAFVIIPAVIKALEAFASSPVGKFILDLIGWLLKLWPLWIAIGVAIALIQAPILLLIAAVVGIIIAIGFVKRHWGEFVDYLRSKWDELPPGVKKAINEVIDFLKGAWKIISAVFTVVLPYIVAFVKTNFALLVNSIKVTLQMAVVVVKAVWAAIKLATELAWKLIKGTVENSLKALTGVFHIFEGLWKGDWHKIWQGIKEIARSVWDQIKLVISLALDSIKGLASLAWDALKSLTKIAWEGLIGLLGALSDDAKRAATKFGNGIKDGIMEALKDLYNWVVNNVINPILSVYNATVAKITKNPITIPTISVAGQPATGMHTNISGTSNPYGLVYDPLGAPGDQYVSPDVLAMRTALRAQGHFAAGVRDWMGGLARVGENGPETVILPPGSSVADNRQTGKIMDNLVNGGRGGTVVNASFNVTAPTIEEIIRQLHRKVEELDRQMRYRAIRSGSPLSASIL